MLAVDTNILVRFLMDDDSEQSAKARQLLSGNRIFVSDTVLLETEWVLRKGFKVPKDELVKALRAVQNLPTITFQDGDRLAAALEVDGMDFADAFHLACGKDCTAFVTFDQDLIRKAQRLGLAVRAP